MVELRAELLQAGPTTRVVRVTALQGERILGSCLGEAADAEQAEDRAAARLLARLGLEDGRSRGLSTRPEGSALPAAPAAAFPASPPPQPWTVSQNRLQHAGTAAPPGLLARGGDGSGPPGAGPLVPDLLGPTPSREAGAPSSRSALTRGPAADASPAGANRHGALAHESDSAAPAPRDPSSDQPTEPGSAASPAPSSEPPPAGPPEPPVGSSPEPDGRTRLEASASLPAAAEPGAASGAAAGAAESGATDSAAMASGSTESRSIDTKATGSGDAAASAGPAAHGSAEEPPADPDDWSQELAGLELQLQRLGWGREQEAVFLQRAFGHPSRSRLTTYADLLAYLRALEGLAADADPAAATVPLRRRDLLQICDQLLAALGWGAEQGRRFLEDQLDVSSRQQLSDAQLLQFNMLLEAELIQSQPALTAATEGQAGLPIASG